MDYKDIESLKKNIANHEERILALEKLLAQSVSDRNKNKGSIQKVLKNSDDMNLSIVNKISDCDEYPAIEKNILDKKSTEGRVLICFYISYKYFSNAWLTTGDVEAITSELGVKILKSNVTHTIVNKLRGYLESGTTRKKGQPTPYRLNRNGAKRAQELIGEE